MANICWFEMRIRGTKENCYLMANSGFRCYELYVKDENGTDEDYMLYLRGECPWSVYGCMIDVKEGDTLSTKAAKFNIELEVCGLDEGGEMPEHYHYKSSTVLKGNYLLPCFPTFRLDEMNLSEEDLAKYTLNTAEGEYVLKEEFAENFYYDWEQGEAVFNFAMSFRDLPGFEE